MKNMSLRWSKTTASEVVELVVAGIVAAFGLAGIGVVEIVMAPLSYYGGIVVGAIMGLLLHEVGHRESARRIGCFARFTLYPLGLLLTIIFGVLRSFGFWFSLIITGYVATQCPYYGRSRVEGWISLWGPLTNILLSLVFLVLIPHVASCCLSFSIGFGEINAWLAFFNLLPFYPLDGSKLLRSYPAVWAILIVVSGYLVFFF